MGNGNPSWLPARRNDIPSRTFAENVQAAIDRYKFNEKSGYFGDKGRRSGIRRLESDCPVRQAHDFFKLLTKGGRIDSLPNGKGWRVDLKDGTVVTLRDHSSDGSPSMRIDISRKYNGRVKTQKIHFIKREQQQ